MFRLKKGVVLFQICGAYFIFPSRSANPRISALITVPKELADFLHMRPEGSVVPELSEEAQKKLQRLIRIGFVEEC